MKKIFISAIFYKAKQKMLKILFPFLLAINILSFGQITTTGSGDYTENIDNILSNLDKSPVTTGILYDRVMSFADLDLLREDGYITTSNYQHFLQSWSELYRASYNPTGLNLEQLKANSQNTAATMSMGTMAIGIPNPPAAQSNTVYIGIINTKMNYIDFGTPSQPSLDYSNGYLYSKPGINPFLEKQVTVIAPLKEKITTNTATFKLHPDYIMQLTGSPIKNLTADFGTGTPYSLITNSINSSSYPTITFSASGQKTFTFTATYSNNTTEVLKATIEVELQVVPTEYDKITGGIYPEAEDFVGASGITQTIPFKGYNESAAASGKLEYRTYYNTVTNPGFDPSTRTFSFEPKLRKEVLILDGYDPGDTRKIYSSSTGYDQYHSSIFELMYYDHDNNPQTDSKNLVNEMQNQGFDVTLVNFPTGADYIERNAMALVALIQRENAKLAANGSTEQIAIIGPSMGGLVSRYALAYMEKNNIPHNTGLWVSFDSPHLGANIPIAAQETLYFFGYKGGQDLAKTKFDENFRSPAARQMLIEQLDYNHENSPYNTNLLPNGGVPDGQNNNTPFRYQFTNGLANNGLAGSGGFPQNLRKIAVINGNTLGIKTNSESQMYLELAAFKIVKYGQIFGTSIQTKINVARIESRFLASPYNSVQTFYGKSANLGNFPNVFISQTVNRSNSNPRGSMDIVPGGMYNTQGIIKDEFDAALNDAIPGRRSIEWRTFVPNHAFIPTVSSLAFKNPDFNWSAPVNRNLICDTNNKEIPFDSYFAPSKNEDHVFVNADMVDWLIKELNKEDQAPYFPIQASQFIGEKTICINSTSEYSFPDACRIPGNASWSLNNSRAQILSSTANTVTLKGISSGSVTLTATFQNGQTFTKKIWVGAPLISITPNESTTNYVTVTAISGSSEASLEEMGVPPTNIVWKRLDNGQTRTGYTYSAHAPGYNWSFDVEVKATNSCGTFTTYTQITPRLPDPCTTYTLVKDEGNSYTVLKSVPPDCPVDPNNPWGREAEQYEITVANSLGVIVISKTGNNFDISSFPTGIYVVNITRDNQVIISQTLIKN